MASRPIMAVLVVVSLLVGFAAGAFVYAPIASPPPSPVANVKMQLDWLVSGEFAPYVAAISQGYYANQGLAVTLIPGQGSGDALRKLAGGSADFTRASLIALEGAHATNRNFSAKLILSQEQNGLVVIYYPKGSISKPTDLVGKKIAAAPFGTLAIFSKVILKTYGIDPSTVTLVSLGFGPMITALATGKVDAAIDVLSDVFDFQAAASQSGTTISYFLASDYGWSDLGYGLMTTTTMMQQHPDVVRKFVAATLQGETYALQHPSDAVKQMVSLYPSLNATVTLQEWGIYAKYYVNQDVAQHGLGYLSTSALTSWMSSTRAPLNVSQSLQPSDIYDSSFLPSPLPTAPTLGLVAAFFSPVVLYQLPIEATSGDKTKT